MNAAAIIACAVAVIVTLLWLRPGVRRSHVPQGKEVFFRQLADHINETSKHHP